LGRGKDDDGVIGTDLLELFMELDREGLVGTGLTYTRFIGIDVTEPIIAKTEGITALQLDLENPVVRGQRGAHGPWVRRKQLEQTKGVGFPSESDVGRWVVGLDREEYYLTLAGTRREARGAGEEAAEREYQRAWEKRTSIEKTWTPCHGLPHPTQGEGGA